MKTRGSEFDRLLWRHLTPQRKKNNMNAQLQSLGGTAPKIFRKIYFLYDFWCTQFVPSRFWTTCTNFDNCSQHYIAKCAKLNFLAYIPYR